MARAAQGSVLRDGVDEIKRLRVRIRELESALLKTQQSEEPDLNVALPFIRCRR